MITRDWAFAASLLASTHIVHAQTLPSRPVTELDRVDPAQVENDASPQPVRKLRPQIEVAAANASLVSGDTRYPVGAVAITGLRVLQPADFVDIIEGYTGRTLTGQELAALSKRVAERMRTRGYIFASARIQPQPLNAGMLIVDADEGVIDRIEVPGPGNAAIAKWLAPLRSGRPVTLAEVERRLLLTGDLPGVWVRRSRYERRGSAGVLIVEVRHDAASGRMAVDNDGSKPTGPAQARIELDINRVFAEDDRVELTYQETILQPRELQYGRLRYVKLVSTSGTELSVHGSFSSAKPGAYLRNSEIMGQSWRAGLGIRHPLLRRRDASVWIDAEVGSRELRQERKRVLARKDRVTTISAGVYGYSLVAGGRVRGRMTISQGLDVLIFTATGDRLASRRDAAPDFTILSGWADWTGDLANRVSLRLALAGQASSTPLLITEEAGLGGGRFLRGYNYNERSGEQALMGASELRYDWLRPVGLAQSAQLYVFGDAGVVGNLRNGRGSGSLASGGGGIRTSMTSSLALDLQIAFPLTGPRYDTDDNSSRFNFQLRQSF